MDRKNENDDRPPEKSGPEGDNPRPGLRGLIIWFLILASIPLVFKVYTTGNDRGNKIGFTKFRQHIERKEISECKIVIDRATGKSVVRGDLSSSAEAPNPDGTSPRFEVEVVVGDNLEDFLTENEVTFEYVYQNPIFLQILSGAIPVILILGALYFLFMRQIRSAGHGALSFGKSRAKLLSQDKHKITFEDVAGIDEAKAEVQEIIEFLKDPKRFQKLGGRIPKGVLLTGPPGTGKTLLAKAIAGEASVPFFSISGSDFVEMFVGVGASRVRDMFEQGKKSAPCIIFIDEIDAVGRSRFSGIGGGHDEREQTLNALLVEMDGFDTQEGVIIVAATNRPDVLDNALLRPGRFDRQIVIDLPTVVGREAILKMHAKKIKLGKSADLSRSARGTVGFSGADLANLLNEAALLAAKEGKAAVDVDDLDEARDKVCWGPERRGHVLDEKEKEITAYHEAGHAVAMALSEEGEPLHKVTIIPRGRAYLGATMQLPVRDSNMEGKRKLEAMLMHFMGGRVAEELTFGDVTSGAAGDLKEATRIARMMICNWGMSSIMGPQAYGANEEHLFLGREVTRSQDFSDETAHKIDEEVNALLRRSHQQATALLTQHRDSLELVAQALLERETLDGFEVEEMIEHGRVLTIEERAEASGIKVEPEIVVEPEIAPAPAASTQTGPKLPDVSPGISGPLPSPSASSVRATIDDAPSTC